MTDLPPEGTDVHCSEDCKQYFKGIEISKLSKTQMKKYQKYLKWEEERKQRRIKQRLKNKQKKQLIHSDDSCELMNKSGPSRKQLKMNSMKDSTCKISVCIDLSFDELMTEKDLAKTMKQILRVYTENRRTQSPIQLHITDLNGKSQEQLAKHNGYEHWDIYFHTENYLSVFPKDRLIYLTSESENVINDLDEEKIYIIGGLVDHNAHKGLCYEKAKNQGISHAQLPIGQYFTLNHRKVLTINQVFEIVLKVSEGGTFKEAFEAVIPKRFPKKPITS